MGKPSEAAISLEQAMEPLGGVTLLLGLGWSGGWWVVSGEW